MSSKSKSSSKSSKSSKHSKSSKSEKHSSHSSKETTKKIIAAEKAVIKLAQAKPKHYTRRRIASKLKENFGREIVRAAIANLKSKEVIAFDHKSVKGKEKKDHVAYMLSRKAA